MIFLNVLNSCSFCFHGNEIQTKPPKNFFTQEVYVSWRALALLENNFGKLCPHLLADCLRIAECFYARSRKREQSLTLTPSYFFGFAKLRRQISLLFEAVQG